MTRLDEIARACLREAGEALRGRGLTVAEQVPGEFPEHPADRAMVARGVEAMLHEAIQRAAPGSQLRVTVKAGPHAFMISIKAPGEGVDPAASEQAVPRAATEAAAAHGGRAWANGLPGRGITFYLTLPAASSGSAPAL